MTGADVPQEQKAGWASFVKSLAQMTGDLSSMTAPPFILSPVSLTEFPAYWCEHPELFASISEGQTEQERVERVLRWFIGTLKAQYTTRNEKMGSEKKPLNPVLGELFYGTWPDVNGRGETVLVVEQVSHHPPITAYYIENKKAGVSLQGHSGQKTSFTGTAINVKQSGHAILTVQPKNGSAVETYLITLPKLRIEGIIWGSPYIELVETSAIQSSTGYTVQIDYKGKGYFSGKAHSFKAILTHNGNGNGNGGNGHPLQTYEGQWTGVATVGGPKGPVFLDTNIAKEEVTVKPVEEQDEWESRRLWEKVAKGIRTGDYDTAGKEKSRIEVSGARSGLKLVVVTEVPGTSEIGIVTPVVIAIVTPVVALFVTPVVALFVTPVVTPIVIPIATLINEQRQRRKDEASSGNGWSHRHFTHVDSDSEYQKLSGLLHDKLTPAHEDAYVYKGDQAQAQ